MFSHEQLEVVRDIKNCPCCGSSWETSDTIHVLLEKFNKDPSYKWYKAVDYMIPRDGRLHIHLVHYILDDNNDNYYVCPNCEEIWRLDNGKKVTGIDKAYLEMALPDGVI